MPATPFRSALRAVAFTCAIAIAAVVGAAPGHDPRADAQLALAMKLYSQGLLDQAVAAVRAGQAIEQRREFLYALGQIERRRGHCLQAVEYYKRYLDTHPPSADEAAARTQIERCHDESMATDPVARAELHFQAGEAAFRLGRYEDAIREWKAGYELSPRSLFLLDLAQAYRRLGDAQSALGMYHKFLDAIPADDARRPEIARVIAEMRPQAEAQARAQSEADTRAHEQPVVVQVTAAPEQPRRSFARRHWWIFPTVGGIAVAAGLAIGLGLYYGRAENHLDCKQAGVIGCIPSTGAQ